MRAASLFAFLIVPLLAACPAAPGASFVTPPASDATPPKLAWTVTDVQTGRVRIIVPVDGNATIGGAHGESFDVQLMAEDSEGIKRMSIEAHRKSTCSEADTQIGSTTADLVTPTVEEYPEAGKTTVPTKAYLKTRVTLDHTCARGNPTDSRTIMGSVANFGSVTDAPWVNIVYCRNALSNYECPFTCAVDDQCPSCSRCVNGTCNMNAGCTKLPELKLPADGGS